MQWNDDMTFEEIMVALERDDSVERHAAKAIAHAHEALRLLGYADPSVLLDEDVQPDSHRA